MAFECPVCGMPQPDAVHLANHLAFTALLGREDHESWLDERVPDWGEMDPTGLAEAVEPHVEPTDDDRFDDLEVDPAPVSRGPSSPPTDPDVRRIVEEAQRLTEQMRGETENE